MRPTAPIARLLYVLVFVTMLVLLVLYAIAGTDQTGTTNALHRDADVTKEHDGRMETADRINEREPLRDTTLRDTSRNSSSTPTAATNKTTDNKDEPTENEPELESADINLSPTEAEVAPTTSQTSATQAPKNTETEKTSVILSSTFSLNEILLLLNTHNDARKAVDIAPLTWSPTLAESAQAWADELKGESCEWYHSDTKYGESIFYSWSSDRSFRRSADEPVFWWLNKEQYYDYEDNSCEPGEVCGHYTQAVWADTRELGCGRVYCDGGEYFEEVWVCQYNPPGNYEGERPY